MLDNNKKIAALLTLQLFGDLNSVEQKELDLLLADMEDGEKLTLTNQLREDLKGIFSVDKEEGWKMLSELLA